MTFLYLKRLHVHQFRNITSLKMDCHPRVNVIIGQNGAGKTSLLEAIYFLSHGRSFRSQEMNRLVQEGAQSFTLFAAGKSRQEDFEVGMLRDLSGEVKNRFKGETLKSTTSITKILPLLLFHPEGFSLFTGGSKLRRQLMDWGAFYAYPAFYTHFKIMRQALRQRNAALRSGLSQKEIEPWEATLITHANAVHALREPYLVALLGVLDELIHDFLKTHHIHLSYYKGWPQDETLQFCLDKSYARDQQFGRTHHGAHRADLKCWVGRKLGRDILSRGQQKFLIGMLKLAQGLLQYRLGGEAPIYLFDDLASELDATHRALIFEHIDQQGAQVFLTSTEKCPSLAQKNSQIFHMDHGNMRLI